MRPATVGVKWTDEGGLEVSCQVHPKGARWGSSPETLQATVKRHPNNLISFLLRSGSLHFKLRNKTRLTIIFVCVEKATHRKHDRPINVMTHYTPVLSDVTVIRRLDVC